MTKKDLIDRKVKGFKFKNTSYANLSYTCSMDNYIGEVGKITYYNCGNDSYRVIFKDASYAYPASEIEKHLVDEWVIGQEYEFSDYNFFWEKGKLLAIVDNEYKYIVLIDGMRYPYSQLNIRHIEQSNPTQEILDQIEVLEKELNNLKSKIK